MKLQPYLNLDGKCLFAFFFMIVAKNVIHSSVRVMMAYNEENCYAGILKNNKTLQQAVMD